MTLTGAPPQANAKVHGTYASRPCARNVRRPGRAVAQVKVLTLAVPAPTTYCATILRPSSKYLRSPSLRLQHNAPKPYCGPGQRTCGRCPCAHNMLRPGHTAAQVRVRTLAAPALTSCCAHAILRPRSRYLRSPPLRSQHIAARPYCGPSQATYARRPCAHDILWPGHNAGWVKVLALAAPALKACYAHAMQRARCAHNTLRPGAAAVIGVPFPRSSPRAQAPGVEPAATSRSRPPP